MNEERTIKYAGVDKAIPGVPKRDLTPAEYEEHKELIDACAVQGLYEVPKEPEVPKAKKSSKKEQD
ncbi:MAG: hypothetical protein AAF702_44460 [Chloroflexota bacterium]